MASMTGEHAGCLDPPAEGLYDGHVAILFRIPNKGGGYAKRGSAPNTSKQFLVDYILSCTNTYDTSLFQTCIV